VRGVDGGEGWLDQAEGFETPSWSTVQDITENSKGPELPLTASCDHPRVLTPDRPGVLTPKRAGATPIPARSTGHRRQRLRLREHPGARPDAKDSDAMKKHWLRELQAESKGVGGFILEKYKGRVMPVSDLKL